jgi:hypothetical protein
MSRCRESNPVGGYPHWVCERSRFHLGWHRYHSMVWLLRWRVWHRPKSIRRMVAL